MNSTLVKIYTLIMLECRLSLEEASKLFRVPKDILYENIKTKTNLFFQVTYLEVECASFPKDLAKARWKVEVLYRRLLRILKVEPKEERIKLLNDFIVSLMGPDITFAKNKNQKYTEEEKAAIIKYRLKYAASTKHLANTYHIGLRTINNWEEELPDDSELKKRLEILREYLTYGYQKINSNNKR